MPNAVLLPPAIALPEELALALATGSPLVVMVSLGGCPFCKIVRESYLVPMRQEQGLPVVQVDMRSQRSVKNFNRLATTHEALIAAWRVEFAPTVFSSVARALKWRSGWSVATFRISMGLIWSNGWIWRGGR